MSRMTINIPFPGFYETNLTACVDHAEAILCSDLAEELGESEERIAEHLWYCVDYPRAHTAIAVAYTAALANVITDNAPRVVELHFEEMISPREYNFQTDRVFATILHDDLAYMRRNVRADTFASVLTERFTEHPGFIPFYSADPEAWDAKPLTEWDANEAGTLLLAWLADNAPPDYADEIQDQLDSDEVFYAAVSQAFDRDALRVRLAAPTN